MMDKFQAGNKEVRGAHRLREQWPTRRQRSTPMLDEHQAAPPEAVAMSSTTQVR